jgi:hypothetical protein
MVGLMDKIKKAFWFSVFLTGAGQFHLGEKKKGWDFLKFSLLGIVFSCVGIVIIVNIFLGLLIPAHYKIFLYLGFFLSVIGLALIIVPGYRSIKDITSRKKIGK